jgi:hypothetical protein
MALLAVPGEMDDHRPVLMAGDEVVDAGGEHRRGEPKGVAMSAQCRRLLDFFSSRGIWS